MPYQGCQVVSARGLRGPGAWESDVDLSLLTLFAGYAGVKFIQSSQLPSGCPNRVDAATVPSTRKQAAQSEDPYVLTEHIGVHAKVESLSSGIGIVATFDQAQDCGDYIADQPFRISPAKLVPTPL